MLIIFFVIYALFIIFFIIFSLFNIFHAKKFGLSTALNRVMLKVYVIVSILLLAGSLITAFSIDWTAGADFLPEGNTFSVPAY